MDYFGTQWRRDVVRIVEHQMARNTDSLIYFPFGLFLHGRLWSRKWVNRVKSP